MIAWWRMVERLDQCPAGSLDPRRHHEYLCCGGTDRPSGLDHSTASEQALAARARRKEHGLLNDNRLPTRWGLRDSGPRRANLSNGIDDGSVKPAGTVPKFIACLHSHIDSSIVRPVDLDAEKLRIRIVGHLRYAGSCIRHFLPSPCPRTWSPVRVEFQALSHRQLYLHRMLDKTVYRVRYFRSGRSDTSLASQIRVATICEGAATSSDAGRPDMISSEIRP